MLLQSGCPSRRLSRGRSVPTAEQIRFHTASGVTGDGEKRVRPTAASVWKLTV